MRISARMETVRNGVWLRPRCLTPFRTEDEPTPWSNDTRFRPRSPKTIPLPIAPDVCACVSASRGDTQSYGITVRLFNHFL